MRSEYDVFPAWMEWPEAAHNVAQVAPDTERLRLVSKVLGFDKLASLKHLKELWCFDITDERLTSLRECTSLRSLFIEGFGSANLSVFGDFSNLEVLSLEDCSRVTNVGALQLCSRLRGLGITNFKNVHSVSEIANLKELRVLAIAGSMWTRMKIRTLDPLSELAELEDLDLSNLKVEDESLRPLGKLVKLKSLNIANFYPTEEFAWLSGRLKNTKCTWFSPYIGFEYAPCKKCGQTTMVMLTGKRKPNLCKQCDSARLAKHVAAFEAAALN